MEQSIETIATYIVELCNIVEHCSFGSSLNDMLSDHIVCRINNTALQQRLSSLFLIYHAAFKIVQAWETADSNSKDLQKPQGLTVARTEQPIMTKPNEGGNSSSVSSISCKHCGEQHPASECKYKQTKCHLYQKKGHLVQIC